MGHEERLAKGLAALRAERCEEAAALLEPLARELGDQLDPWLYLGVARARLGDLAGAEEALLQARAIEPIAALPHYNLGRLYERLDRPDDAAVCYHAALAQDRHHQPSRLRLEALRSRLSADYHERPLAPPQCLKGFDLLSVLKLSLTFAAAVALMAFTVALLAVLAFGDQTDSYSALITGLVAAADAGGLSLLSGFLPAMLYNVAVGWRGTASLRLGSAGDWTVVEEVDPYPFARAAMWTLLVLLLFNAAGVFPSLLVFLEALDRLEREGPNLAPVLSYTLAAQVVAFGCSFVAVVVAVVLYNCVQSRTGGLRFRHASRAGRSEAVAVAVGPLALTMAVILAPLVLPAILLVAAPLILGPYDWGGPPHSHGPVPLPSPPTWGWFVLVASSAALLLAPYLGGLLYNVHAAVFGGLAFQIEDE